MKEIIDLKFIVDFEVYNHLVFKYSDLNNNETFCFEIKDIFKYLTKTRMFLLLQQINGNKYTLSTEIYNIQISEKEHKLDINESLTVSNHLVEEIFDKINSFTEIAENDKENLLSLIELQNLLIQKTSLLEVFSRDLNSGSKKFQEFMFENFNKNKLVSPESLPKLMTIKQKIENLTRLQTKVFERFVNIKKVVNTKKIFKKTFENFSKMNLLLKKVVEEISSKEFKDFFERTKQMMKVIKKDHFSEFFKEVENVINYQNSSFYTIGGFSLGVVFIALVVLLTFAGLILRIINNEKKIDLD